MFDLREGIHSARITGGEWERVVLLPSVSRQVTKRVNGIHGQKRIWSVYKETELSALNKTLEEMLG